jgi:serine phosphatase RsbU (regulator of sigma subunit)
VGLLTLQWRQNAAVGTTQHVVSMTLADLIGQTLGRTALSQQEHDVIVQLQRDLLPPPVAVGGLDVAVGYQPAMSVVGLGGDFYDLIVSDAGRVFAVIGDISGHGSRAVAVMSELKSVVQHLLRSGASIGTVCAQADLLLVRRDMLATAQICEIDLDQHVLRYVNAGHPYPILRQVDGTTTTLRSGHRPLLGLAEGGDILNDVASTPFSEGDVLLLYTDGLIERRDQPIDDAIDQLVHLVRDEHIATMDVLVSRLQERLLRPDERSDDDVALLAVRCLGSERRGDAND